MKQTDLEIIQNCINKEGNNILAHACQTFGKTEKIIYFLLYDFQVDPYHKNYDGKNSFDLVRSHKSKEILMLWLVQNNHNENDLGMEVTDNSSIF